MPDPDFTIGQGDSAAVLTGTVQDAGGDPVSLNGAAAILRVSPLAGGSAIVTAGTVTIDQNGDGSDGSMGQWSYGWQAGETDLPGWYLGQVEVTFQSGAVQTFPEPGYMLIKIEEQLGGAAAPTYVTREELKVSREMTGYGFEDHDIDIAVLAASRSVDSACSRRFYLDGDANNVRIFTARSHHRVWIDDLAELTTLKIDRDGDGTYEETWDSGRYILEPFNAAADGKPWESILARPVSGWTFPTGKARVEVTGRFGWAAVPPEIRSITSVLASKSLMRKRSAPFGIVSIGAEVGALMRIARTDPDLAPIIASYSRATPFI